MEEYDNENENIPIKKIKNLGLKIGSDTKVIINSPKFPNANEQYYNYNTFSTFKSIDDIFYLVYIKEGDDIVFYNLIDEKEVIVIKVRYLSDISHTVEIKHLFDENNQRDLLLSLSKNLMIWNVNNFECLYNIEIKTYQMKFAYKGSDHLGILELNNKSYSIIVNNQDLKIFDLNGNKLTDNYISDLQFEKDYNLDYIGSYYDKKLCKTYIFFNHKSLWAFDYQKRELYKKLPKIFFGYKHIIINDDSEKLIKLIYLINYDSIGVFNFHSGQLLYIINLAIILVENKELEDCYHYDSVYI